MLLPLGLFVAALSSPVTGPAPAAASGRVIVEARIDRNTVDGPGRRSCSKLSEIVAGRPSGLWFTFGQVAPAADGAWEATGNSSHCGDGDFATASPGFTRTVGVSYVILELSAARSNELRVEIGLRRFERFDAAGKPVYQRSTYERALELATPASLTFPMFSPDPGEKETFGVHEVVLRLDVETLPEELAESYGTLAVTAGVPGARVLVDGHAFGRTSDGEPTVVRHIPVGNRQVRIVDLSGRSVEKTVTVKAGKVAGVALDLPQISTAAADQSLVPIGANLQGFDEYWRSLDSAIMVRIPAGEFTMGSPAGSGEPHERPQHRVFVSAFLIDKTEVTWRQYRKFADQTGVRMPPVRVLGTPDHDPAHNVSWDEAQAYCEWTGGRLPTEAEWEKAARGTDARTYPWGNEWDPDRCNSWIGGPNRPAEVGAFEACVSPYGLLDMAGNMWEWCADFYEEDYYAASPERDPRGPTSSRFRVLRGGDWVSQPLWLRAAHRYRIGATIRYRTSGFRCARDRKE